MPTVHVSWSATSNSYSIQHKRHRLFIENTIPIHLLSNLVASKQGHEVNSSRSPSFKCRGNTTAGTWPLWMISARNEALTTWIPHSSAFSYFLPSGLYIGGTCTYVTGAYSHKWPFATCRCCKKGADSQINTLTDAYTCFPKYYGYMTTVNPRLPDTPEMWPSMVMRTICLVQNAISIDLHTIRTPEMWPPCYSIKKTLSMAPAVSPPMQTHPHSRHIVNTFVDSLVKQTATRATS